MLSLRNFQLSLLIIISGGLSLLSWSCSEPSINSQEMTPNPMLTPNQPYQESEYYSSPNQESSGPLCDIGQVRISTGECVNEDSPEAMMDPPVPQDDPIMERPIPPEQPEQPSSPCGFSSLRGIVCAPNGESIVGAQVRVLIQDCHGELQEYSTVTETDGSYQFGELSVGSGSIEINAGSFQESRNIELVSGEELNLNNGETCFTPDQTRLAVITGAYDSIEHALDRLGFEYDAYCGDVSSFGARALLGNPQLLSQYDVLFVNCGQNIDFNSFEGQQMVQNLRNFVNAGGSVYASDLAAGLVDRAFPNVFNFNYDNYQGWNQDQCCTCTNNCPAYCGSIQQTAVSISNTVCLGVNSPQTYCEFFDNDLGFGYQGSRNARILNPNLRDKLGRDTLTINFDLEGWVEMYSSSPQLEVLVEDTNNLIPLMVRYSSPAEGRVIYTSFHNERQSSRDLETILQSLIFEL